LLIIILSFIIVFHLTSLTTLLYPTRRSSDLPPAGHREGGVEPGGHGLDHPVLLQHEHPLRLIVGVIEVVHIGPAVPKGQLPQLSLAGNISGGGDAGLKHGGPPYKLFSENRRKEGRAGLRPARSLSKNLCSDESARVLAGELEGAAARLEWDRMP